MRIGTQEISEYTKENGSKAFCFLILLKRDNPRGVVFVENIPSTHLKYGISKSSLYRHINWLVDRDLIKRDGKGNLALKTIDREGNKKSFSRNKIKIDENDNLNTVRCKLFANVMARHRKQCRFMAELKEESVKMKMPNNRLTKYKTVRALKKAQSRYIKTHDKNPEKALNNLTYEPEIKISDKKVAKMLGISASHYNSKVKKDLRRMGLVIWTSVLIQLPYQAEFHQYDPQVTFAHKGKAYYSYTEYRDPTEEPEITVFKKTPNKFDTVLEDYAKMWEEIEAEEIPKATPFIL